MDLPADDPDLAIHPSLLREIDLPSELQGLAFHVPQAREIQHATGGGRQADGRFSDEENLYDLWRRAEEIRRYLEARPERLTVVVAHGGRHRLLAVRPSR